MGVEEARGLLNAQTGTAAFMIVITDGNGGDPAAEADAARADGTIVFAVGVGTTVIYSDWSCCSESLLDVAFYFGCRLPCPSLSAYCRRAYIYIHILSIHRINT